MLDVDVGCWMLDVEFYKYGVTVSTFKDCVFPEKKKPLRARGQVGASTAGYVREFLFVCTLVS